jgi:large subunit ribosomal protein L3
MKGILGKKLGMSQVFGENGEVIPVTIIEAGPCYVTQKKSVERDGYEAVQIGFEEVKPNRLTKPELNHLSKKRYPPIALSARDPDHLGRSFRR